LELPPLTNFAKGALGDPQTAHDLFESFCATRVYRFSFAPIINRRVDGEQRQEGNRAGVSPVSQAKTKRSRKIVGAVAVAVLCSGE